MNGTFDISRISRFLNSQLKGKGKLFLAGIIFSFLLLIVYNFISPENRTSAFTISFMTFPLIFNGYVLNPIHSSRHRKIEYLTLPVSTIEKFIVFALISVVIIPAYTIIVPFSTDFLIYIAAGSFYSKMPYFCELMQTNPMYLYLPVLLIVESSVLISFFDFFIKENLGIIVMMFVNIFLFIAIPYFYMMFSMDGFFERSFGKQILFALNCYNGFSFLDNFRITFISAINAFTTLVLIASYLKIRRMQA